MDRWRSYFYEENRAQDLFDAATIAEKPERNTGAGMPFRFPKYINERIYIQPMEPMERPRIEYLRPAKAVPPSPPNYKIYGDRILADKRTACMIKNIPNKYTSEMLIDFINETHFGTYDFFYLRVDFKNRCNVGYAFINFVDSQAVEGFYRRIHGMRWSSFGSNKIAELTYASIQGIDSLKRKFRRSLVMQEDRSFRPKAFYTEGKSKGLEKREFG